MLNAALRELHPATLVPDVTLLAFLSKNIFDHQ